MKVEYCELCGKKKKKILAHHLSYVPETIIYLCVACHFSLHYFGRLTDDQFVMAKKWINDYRYEWIDGNLKNHQCKYTKELAKQRRKTPKYISYNKKFRDEHKELIRRIGVKWRKENKEKIKLHTAKYREKNRDILRSKNREYLNNLRRKVREQLLWLSLLYFLFNRDKKFPKLLPRGAGYRIIHEIPSAPTS